MNSISSEAGFTVSTYSSRTVSRVKWLVERIKRRGQLQAVPWLVLFTVAMLGVVTSCQIENVFIQQTLSLTSISIGVVMALCIYLWWSRPILFSLDETVRTEVQDLGPETVRAVLEFLAAQEDEYASVLPLAENWLR